MQCPAASATMYLYSGTPFFCLPHGHEQPKPLLIAISLDLFNNGYKIHLYHLGPSPNLPDAFKASLFVYLVFRSNLAFPSYHANTVLPAVRCLPPHAPPGSGFAPCVSWPFCPPLPTQRRLASIAAAGADPHSVPSLPEHRKSPDINLFRCVPLGRKNYCVCTIASSFAWLVEV